MDAHGTQGCSVSTGCVDQTVESDLLRAVLQEGNCVNAIHTPAWSLFEPRTSTPGELVWSSSTSRGRTEGLPSQAISARSSGARSAFLNTDLQHVSRPGDGPRRPSACRR